MRLSPQEFEDLDKDHLPQPLNYLVQEILKIAYEELGGSPFLTRHLHWVTTQMEIEGSLTHDILAFQKAERLKALEENLLVQREFAAERGYRSLQVPDPLTWDQVHKG